MSNLHIFTFATHTNHHLDRLMTSSKKNNLNITILGLNQVYTGNGMKITLLLEALKKLNPNDLFLYIDAYDVIFLKSEDAILNAYTTYYKDKLVYGAEQNFGMYSFDDLFYYLKYPIKNVPMRYLNAGTIMGPAKLALDCYNDIGLSAKQTSDQMDTIRYFVKNPEHITVDHRHELFGVNGGRAGLEYNDYEIREGKLYSKRTDTWPCLLHIPGKFFTGLDSISYKLGFMDQFPIYTKKELDWRRSQLKDHKICDQLTIDNYKLRLIKNYLNLVILTSIAMSIIFKFT